MIRVIIVEDSKLARVELVDLLKNEPQIEIVAEAENGERAIQLIDELQPDLIFLDIHLPDMDGFEVLNSISIIPQLIFTTAYDEYAIKSFNYSTIDYLLKPIRSNKLSAAIQKVKLEKEQKAPLKLENSIFINDGNHYSIAHLADIELFHTEGNYTKVFFNGNSPMLNKSLNQIEKRLDSTIFLRINRQEIVNIRHITHVEKWFKGKLKLTLTSGKTIEVSERQSIHLKRILSI
jgi:two-component system LytT family response regulator